MKLSKKFKERYNEFTALYDQDCLEIIEQYELQPDDVEGCVILTLDEAKNIYHDFASMYVIAKGTYPKDGMRKPFTLDILKMEIVKAEVK
jgi:hypothetical protein